jgi:hypothetical protein
MSPQRVHQLRIRSARERLIALLAFFMHAPDPCERIFVPSWAIPSAGTFVPDPLQRVHQREVLPSIMIHGLGII